MLSHSQWKIQGSYSIGTLAYFKQLLISPHNKLGWMFAYSDNMLRTTKVPWIKKTRNNNLKQTQKNTNKTNMNKTKLKNKPHTMT